MKTRDIQICDPVARQELILTAALTGEKAAALAARAIDPMLRNPETAGPMPDALLDTNASFGFPFAQSHLQAWQAPLAFQARFSAVHLKPTLSSLSVVYSPAPS